MRASHHFITETAHNRYNAKRTILAMLPYLWHDVPRCMRWRVVVSLVCLVLAKVVAVATPFLYKHIVDGLATPNAQGTWIVILGMSGLVISYAMARMIRVICNEVRHFIFIRVEQRALQQIAVEILDKVHSLSLRYHITRKTGALSRIIDRCIRGVESVLQVIVFNLAPLMFEFIAIAVVIAVVFDIRYVLIIMGMLVAYAIFTNAVTEWRVNIRKRMNAKDREATQHAIDGLLNYETVKYFNAERHEIHRYGTTIGEYGDEAVRLHRSMGILNIGQACIVSVGIGATLALGAFEVSNGTITIGAFVMIHSYLLQIVMPMDFLGFMYNRLRQSLADMGDAFDLLSQNPDITDVPNAPDLHVTKGDICFDSVCFDYTEQKTTIHNVSFDVPSGNTVAIVGASGAGKSTIGRLLFRFYEAQSGTITIDGQDITRVTQSSLHESIGIIPQDTVLFNDSIYYNLSYGTPDATFERVQSVAQQAQLHDFIMSLPAGYDTIVGERGLKLSGGEKQRVGIARTLLKNPKILVLDEATSALDTHTESQIQHNVYTMSKGRTVIAIAHRLSTIIHADTIIVLDKGRIAEHGTHAVLMAHNGIYAHMWDLQKRES